MKPIVIFGASDIAQIAHFYLTHDSPYKITAFTVDSEYLNKKEFCELPVVPFEEIKKHYPPDQYDMFIAVSYIKLNTIRAKKYEEAKAKGYSLINYVSSKATNWPGLSIGENCFILEDNTIQPFVKIGNNVTIWSGNHIGHHSIIEDHCFISSHVVISGHVRIKSYCFLGVNATIRNDITIEKECIVGAGTFISKSTKEKGVYVRVGAKLFSKDSSQIEI